MRSTQADAPGRTITFAGVFTDAATGSGVAQPGSIPYTFIRTNSAYQFFFDTRLRALSATALVDNTARAMSSAGLGAGTFTIIRFLTGSGAAEAGGSTFSCTALDRRT